MRKTKAYPAAPSPPDQTQGFHPTTHGNWAQWAAVIAALLFGLTNLGLTIYFHHMEGASKASDEHVNALIDARLNPAVQAINDNIEKKLGPLGNQLTDLVTRVGKLEGRFEQLDAEQKRATKLQLDRLNLQIKGAEATGIKTDPQMLVRLGNDLLVASSDKANSTLAWEVLNRTLSYHSTIAPISLSGRIILSTPNKDTECLTIQPGADHWTFEGFVYTHCTQHLDPLLGPVAVKNSLIFNGVIFKDVRVIYSGGPLKLDGVYFVDCTFELQPSDKSKVLAETLLASNAVTLHLP